MTAPPTRLRRLGPDAMPRTVPAVNNDEVWYVSYGSNMCRSRLNAYLAGGSVAGSAVVEAGARDTTAPREARALRLPGQLYFADHSTRWFGGVGYYDPDGAGEILARGWRITVEQLSDIIAQEMRRPIGTDLPWQRILEEKIVAVGPGSYETCVLLGHLDGIPMVTFTRPEVADNEQRSVPSADYLDMLAAGLVEGHGLSPAQAHRHLGALIAA